MLEFVQILLDSCDNLIDQLILLKKYSNNKEVQKYIKALNKMNLSPYTKYCIDKYYYNLDVPSVEIPKFFFYDFRKNNNSYINKLLENVDGVKEQILVLKKHKEEKEVNDYACQLFPSLIDKYPYMRYLILNYYYDIYYPEVTPSAKTLQIKLIKIYFPEIKKVGYDE